jgi:hypothetical protein
MVGSFGHPIDVEVIREGKTPSGAKVRVVKVLDTGAYVTYKKVGHPDPRKRSWLYSSTGPLEHQLEGFDFLVKGIPTKTMRELGPKSG